MEEARAALEKRRRRRRVAVLLLVLLPLVLAGGAWLFLQTGAGEALVRRQVLGAVGDALAGKVELGGFQLAGEHLVLTDLALYTPEGELVASIARLEADVELNALARQRVHLQHVKVTRPRLFLVQDERGWNLSRAVAAKTPSAPSEASGGPNRWQVQVDGFELFEGELDLQQEDRRLTATAVGARGDAHVRLEPLEVTGALSLTSALTRPLEEQLELEAGASVAGGPQRYTVELSLGGTKLRGAVELPSLALTIDELTAAPKELAAFVPGWPVRQVVFGQGALSPRHAKLELRVGKGRVTLDSRHDLEKSSAEHVALSVRSLDLAEVLGAPLPSVITLDATGAFQDWRPDTLAGGLDAKGTWDGAGQRLATVSLDATAARGQLTVRTLGLQTPGAKLTANGSVSREAVALTGALQAGDLSLVRKTLATFANAEVPGLAGSGALDLTVKGPWRAPALKAVGTLERLALASLSAESVKVDADLPNVLQPVDSDILLEARRLTVSGRSFDEVRLDFYTHGRELDLDLSTRGLGDLKVHVLGVLDKDANGAALNTMELTSSDAKWVLEGPTRVSWSPRVEVDPFTLRNGEQLLSGRLQLKGNRLDAAAHVERMDLARLPRLLALEPLGLAGLLDGDVTVSGRTSKPELSAKVQLRGGRVKGFTDLDLALDATWKKERAAGRFTAKSALGQAEGTFDLPVLAFLDEKPEPGTAHVSVKGLDLATLARQLGEPLPADGVVDATLDLSGAGDHPDLRLTTTSPQLAVALDERRLDTRNLRFTVVTDDAHQLAAELEVETLGGRQQVRLSTPLTLASLRRSPPDREALLGLPVTLALELGRVELAPLVELGLLQSSEPVAGAVALTGAVRGSARAPTGGLTLTLDQVDFASLKAAGGKLAVRTSDAGKTQVNAELSLAQKPALALVATLGALPERALRALLAPDGDADAMVAAVADVPLDAELRLAPFDLTGVLPRRGERAAPSGVASATLELQGTLEAPTARAYGSVQDLRFDRAALGSARFDLRSTPREQRFTVALGGQGRDDFKAKGTTGLDLRLSSVRKGLAWRQAPLDVTIESRNFDLGFLSGSTELLRVVAGRLDLSGRVQGTLGTPRFDGDASVRQGRLALAGYGDYRNIELEVHVDDQLFELRKLEAKSGAGQASLVAKAARQRSGAWLLTSSGETDKFPIVSDDQLLATTTLKYTLEGDVTPNLIDVRSLALPRVDVRLPEIKRKDIQDLDRPDDIIVLRGGRRPTRKERVETREVAAQQQHQRQGEGGLVVRAVLEAPRNLWVRSSDVNLELGLSDGFRVEYRDAVRLFGEARVLKGELEVIGRKFTVQKGSEVRFAGPAAQPYVNVTALHENTREQVKITVTVAGRGSDVTIKASSEPPMPESDIYAVLATGRRNLKNSGGTAFSPGQAASVVGQYATSQIKTVMAKALPIDVLNFETSDNFDKWKLDVGKYLSDTVYLGGSVNIGARRERGENVWAGRLELQVTRSVSLEAYAGDALSFGADAMWSVDF